MCDLLWSDPQPQVGRSMSKRGVGTQFGPDVTQAFLKDNNLDYVIRSHEVKQEGYEVMHDGKCITIFSAPNYWLVDAKSVFNNIFKNIHRIRFSNMNPNTPIYSTTQPSRTPRKIYTRRVCMIISGNGVRLTHWGSWESQNETGKSFILLIDF